MSESGFGADFVGGGGGGGVGGDGGDGSAIDAASAASCTCCGVGVKSLEEEVDEVERIEELVCKSEDAADVEEEVDEAPLITTTAGVGTRAAMLLNLVDDWDDGGDGENGRGE